MNSPAPLPGKLSEERLESWKEIAGYLGKGVRTVVRWEKSEGLPVHRHMHERRPSVFAYKSEIEEWWQGRRASLDEEKPAAPREHRVNRMWLAALIPMAASAIWLVRPVPVRTPGFPLNFKPLTSYPGAQYAPSFSPDGGSFAFAWNAAASLGNVDIYVQAIESAEPLRLTRHPDMEFSPAWSPDGKWIAFLRRSPWMQIEILLIPPSGGPERKLADIAETHYMDATELSWFPDGKRLVFADRGADGHGVYSLNIETGERRRITHGLIPRNDLNPAISPDGRRLAFRRGENESLTEIWVQELTGEGRPAGEPRSITHRRVRSTSPVWSGDGRWIFFSSGVFRSETNLYRVRASPGTPGPPEQVTESDGASHFSLAASRRGGILAYTFKRSDVNLWAIEKTGQVWKAPEPIPMLSSTRSDQDPGLSPDGTQIAFVSDRSGHQELWAARRDGSHARRLTSFRGAQTASPRWSPDSSQIAFAAQWRDAFSIWVIGAAGGAPRKLVEPGWSPSWSRDGRSIYYSAEVGASTRIFKVPSEGGPPAPVVDGTPSRDPVESCDGRFLFYRGEGGIWRIPLAGGRAVPVAKLDWITPYAVTDDGVYFMGPPNRGFVQRALLYQPLAGGPVQEVARTGTRPVLGLAASPDGKTLLYSQADQEFTSLMFVRGLW